MIAPNSTECDVCVTVAEICDGSIADLRVALEKAAAEIERLRRVSTAEHERANRAERILEASERRADDAQALAARLGARADELESLINTAEPCGWPVPELQSFHDGTTGVAWESLGEDVEAEEAIAVGAMVVRAGLAALKATEAAR